MNSPFPESPNASKSEPSSADDARRRAEFNRAQIANTLDHLSHRINETVQTAQERINMPLNVVRRHPLMVIGASVALGFLIAATANRKQRRDAMRAQNFAQSYYDGRRDEHEHRPPRQLSLGNPPQGRPFGLSFRSSLLDLALPLIRTVSGNMAEMLFARKFRR